MLGFPVFHPLIHLGYCTVAYATADGAVGIAKVTQSVVVVPSPRVLVPECSVQSDFDPHALVFEADRAGISLLSWVTVSKEKVK